MNELAIVIPAFKDTYLKDVLISLANQTDKRFNVYIGDDCSKFNLYNIIKPFIAKLNISYTRFENNLGSTDLISHWNRCLKMIGNESWFLMFSDDDILSPTCIENFYKAKETYSSDVFHYNLKIIDSENKIIRSTPNYPEVLTSVEFFEKLYKNEIEARMPEFIFKKRVFDELGGFINFPLAMRSDNAAVIQTSKFTGIRTIPNSYVNWRESGQNISVGGKSKERYLYYYYSLVDFFNWKDDFFDKNNFKTNWTSIDSIEYLYNYGVNIEYIIGKVERKSILKRYNKFPNGIKYYLVGLIIILKKVYKKFRFLYDR